MRYIFILVFTLFSFVMLKDVENMASLQKNDDEYESATSVATYYGNKLTDFYHEVLRFDSLVNKNLNEEALKPDFLRLREAFKRTEFLLSYLDIDEVRRINGAPITINNYHYQTPFDEKPPGGLQVIEELLYNSEDGTYQQLKDEVKLLRDLITTSLDLYKIEHIPSTREFNVFIWDAIRLELFRIETLGITGFDVPECLNAIPETKCAMESLEEVVHIFEPVFRQKKMKKHYKYGISIFEKSKKLLEKTDDFNDFNRLEYMTEVLHPLQKWTKQTIDELGYEFPSNLKPIANEATFLYDSLFFNPVFFAPPKGMSLESISLGKKLFNDPVLSVDGSRSCATCHRSDKGLADGLVKNISIDGKELLKRNTPSLWNVQFQTRFFYDSRAKRMEIQVLDVIHNPLEMGGNLAVIIEKLKENPEYVEQFNKAFNGNINKTTITNALADYVRSLVSFNSRFDRYLRGERTLLSESEKNGFNIFAGKGKCATCHFAPMFNGLVPPHYTDNESEILGVPLTVNDQMVLDSDFGKFDNTRLELHRYAFKTMTVRNVELTAPYMHNGVFATLEEVIEFYEKGGGVGQGMNLPSQTLSSARLNLTDREKKDLINFLKTLTYKPKQ